MISERGKRLKSGVVETNGRALVEFLKTVPGRTHLCLEEGTQSGWLYEVLSPHVDEIVVTHLQQQSRGRKDDETDAFARAEELRVGAVQPVFKDGGRMGELRAHVDVQEPELCSSARYLGPDAPAYRGTGPNGFGHARLRAFSAVLFGQVPGAGRDALSSTPVTRLGGRLLTHATARRGGR
ncbi:MAG: hypothetical protein PVI30_27045 [Myxococcales bacterium]